MPFTSGLVTTTILNTKISKVENKIPGHSKYISTQQLNKLTAENFATRLKQVNLVSTSDFDNKLISFNTKNTLNNTKYSKLKKKKIN